MILLIFYHIIFLNIYETTIITVILDHLIVGKQTQLSKDKIYYWNYSSLYYLKIILNIVNTIHEVVSTKY